jgi:hypothetical protein
MPKMMTELGSPSEEVTKRIEQSDCISMIENNNGYHKEGGNQKLPQPKWYKNIDNDGYDEP